MDQLQHEHPGRCHFESHLQIKAIILCLDIIKIIKFKVWVVGTFPKMVNG